VLKPHHRMHNGATVADWCGTARMSADIAATLLARVRSGATTRPLKELERAETELIQALTETHTLISAARRADVPA